MAGNNKSEMKLFGEGFSGNQISFVDAVEQDKWSELAIDVLERIIYRLSLKENIRVSAVCNAWHNIAISLRVVKKSPWLMRFPISNDLFKFYDPTKGKTYSVKFPEIQSFTACYTKDNWILLSGMPIIGRVLLFNPFSRQHIQLPNIKLYCQKLAFSCSPTSPGCIVFAIVSDNGSDVTISTCQPGATEWSTINYPNHQLPFNITTWSKIVVNNGVFYCIDQSSSLGVYDPQAHTWTVRRIPSPRFPDSHCLGNWLMGKFMTEHEGDIYVIYICHTEKPVVYKLDQTDNEWIEIRNLGGLTFFAGFLTSYVKPAGLVGGMKNCVYFTRVDEYGRCVYYCVDDGNYYPKKPCREFIEQVTLKSIWIEPPQDFEDFT